MIKLSVLLSEKEIEALSSLVFFEYSASDFEYQDEEYQATIKNLNEILNRSTKAIKKLREAHDGL